MDAFRLIVIFLMASLLFAGCGAAKRPDEIPLHQMSVRDMFPGNPQAQALALAAARGDIAEMDRLAAAGADPNAVGTRGATVPVWVLWHPNKKGFQRLLELGADPNMITRTERGREYSLMHRAVERSVYIGVEYLQMAIDIGHGDPNLEIGELRRAPIKEALFPGHMDAFAVLLKSGVDIEYTTSIANIPLVMMTAEAHNYKATLYLLQNGVDYKKETTFGNSLMKVMQFQINKNHWSATTPVYPHNMWFWRCVDFLEKRGETFTLTPQSQRPAVLDTEPPDIFAGLRQ